MENSKKTPNQYLIWIVIFICGFISGVGVAVYKLQPTATENAATNQQTQGGVDHNVLHKLEEEVKNNPDNHQAWIQLGHLYFDSNQPVKAIEAYEKSLSLAPGNPDLWTDLGIMYRRAENPQKAIECFEKATSLNPNHEQSRFNKGIVLLYDIGDTEKAIVSFEELLAINPEAQSSNGGRIADFVEHLKSKAAKKK